MFARRPPRESVRRGARYLGRVGRCCGDKSCPLSIWCVCVCAMRLQAADMLEVRWLRRACVGSGGTPALVPPTAVCCATPRSIGRETSVRSLGSRLHLPPGIRHGRSGMTEGALTLLPAVVRYRLLFRRPVVPRPASDWWEQLGAWRPSRVHPATVERRRGLFARGEVACSPRFASAVRSCRG